MKWVKLVSRICACMTAAVFLAPAMRETSFAEDAPKAVLVGQIGENEIWDDGAVGAQNPEITGDAVYSAYLPLKYSDSVQFLALDIDGITASQYENLSVTVDKIRIDGQDYEFTGTPAVNMNYKNGDFSGTRVYIADSWEGNPSALPSKTVFAESVEVIFRVSGTGKSGPDFVDKRAPESSPTETETQAQTETEEALTEAETQPATGGVRPGNTEVAETTIASETDVTETTSGTSLTTVFLPPVTMGGADATKIRAAGSALGSAPVTGEKSLVIAFAGLIITAGAAVLTKIKRK